MSANDLSQVPMAELFRIEAEGQIRTLTAGLLALERAPRSPEQLAGCMRAAHSLKGAARIVGLGAGANVAHAMEDCFVAAQRGEVVLDRRRIDALLRGVDLLNAIAATPEAGRWAAEGQGEIAAFLAALGRAQGDAAGDAASDAAGQGDGDGDGPAAGRDAALLRPQAAPAAAAEGELGAGERMLRVTPEDLNHLLDLAGGALMAFRRLRPFIVSLSRLQRLQQRAGRALAAREPGEKLGLGPGEVGDHKPAGALEEAQIRLAECQSYLSERLAELDTLDRRFTVLAHGLYEQALACRMRPFADGTSAFPRMIRDLGRELGKSVRLQLGGLATRVDRDMLQMLEAPIGHLLRNAIDHGIEAPERRFASGKPEEGVIRLEACHAAGMLEISITDDGAGIDLAALREAVLARKLAGGEILSRVSEAELLEFLFLPGFTMKAQVTEISGRGVGLNVVREMVQSVRGVVQVFTQAGIGTSFKLRLPLSLSVIRALLVEIGGEAYGLPLAGLRHALRLPRRGIEYLEGRPHFAFQGELAGLVSLRQILECGGPEEDAEELCVVLLGTKQGAYGMVVDGFLGERELVVQTLDRRLGSVKDVSTGALLEDGAPVLILDPDDLIRSAEKLAVSGRLRAMGAQGSKVAVPRKRVLVVDDSFTVREVERKLLTQHGYEAELAVDGMDGWNVVRAGKFDLVVTDIDMPRMDGIELARLIKGDPVLRTLPVLIVSYKDREEDRRRGLEAGADYYLSKGSFHDETLIRAVADLIGGAAS